MSNSSNPDQARHFVGPGLGPNCLKRLSADDSNKVKPVLSGHSKLDKRNVLKTGGSLEQKENIVECSIHGSILQYFPSALSDYCS